MRPLALRSKLTFVYTSVLALFVIAIAIAYYHTLRYHLNSSITEELLERSSGIRGYIRISGDDAGLTYDETDPEELFFVETATRLFQIQRIRDGDIMVQSPAMRALGLRFTPSEIAAFMAGPALHDIETEHGTIRLVSTVLPSEGDGRWLMLVGTSMQPLDTASASFLDTLAIVLPISLIAAGYLGWLMAGRALRPLKVAAEAAENITTTQFGRLPVRGAADELDHLSEAFNRTFARLEAAIGEMKQFTASIAHELRTPLTVLRGEAELALMQSRNDEEYRQVLSSQLEEFDKLIRMINQTLVLARAESGEIRLTWTVLNLGTLIDELAGDLQTLARAKGIRLDCNLEPGILVMGDAGWLERMALNLMDNAIKFTPSEGQVSIRIRREHDFAALEVSDTGRGIAADALPHIFDRFFRADPSRSRDQEGAGLGLTLVEWIVRQHHGFIHVASHDGCGATFTVRLPLSDTFISDSPHINSN
jgi:heavy metal sensor kinase